MSSSVFKEYPSQRTDEDAKAPKFDSNLVVFINKNGSVSVDHSALQDLLVNDAMATNTSVSVIRVGSPTPSLQTELNEQEELENEIRNAELGTDDDEDAASSEKDEDDDEDDEEHADEQEDDASDEDAECKTKQTRRRKTMPRQQVPNVSLIVENYFNPAEAKQLASEILNIAGISNPQQITVDFEFKRYVVANDHCYTPYTSPSQRNLHTETVRLSSDPHQRTSTADGPSSSSTTHATSKTKHRKASLNLVDKSAVSDDEEDAEQSQHSEDEAYTDSDGTYVSPSESDRDSDLDFSVKDSSAKVRKARLAAKRQNKAVVRGAAVPKKRHSLGADGTNAQPSTDDVSKKKSTKSQKKIIRIVSSAATSTPIPKISSESTVPPSLTLVDPAWSSPVTSTIPKIVSVTIKPKPNGPVKVITPSTIKLVQQRPPSIATPNHATVVLTKHVKKPAGNSESALFSDMSSLFSTPDIIKKVKEPTSSASSTTNSNRVTNISVINLPPVTLTPIPLNSNNTTYSNHNKTLFMSLTPTTTRRPATLPASTTIRPAVKVPQNNALPNTIIFNNVHRAATIQQLPASTFQPIMTNNQIVHCQPPLNSIQPVTTTIQNSSNQHIMPFAPLLNDADLLDGLANVEETLSEDLMQHVAKLVEDKNLQQVIDQQVLGVHTVSKPSIAQPLPFATYLDTKSFVVSAPTTATPKPAATVETPPTTPAANLRAPPLIAVASKPKPEPIKIVRSDGRVITLPPIEAPTTRGAKRRAQNQAPSSAASSPASASPATQPSPSQPSSQPPTMTPDRRPSVAAARKSMTPKSKSTVVALAATGKTPIGTANALMAAPFNADEVIVLDDDDEEDGSDGSYNSEDDPYRLWCICRQPHNNRFMICCDKCEDWFHGKCVSVTKAMGVEMEERGVEWVCPNCIKKHPHLQQRQLAVLAGRKIANRKASNSSLVLELSATASALDNSLLSCIVCKKAARQNSIYCSDDCIRLHAQTTVVTIQDQPPVAKTPTTPVANDTQPKLAATSQSNTKTFVEVIERTTGRFLTGNSAPTADNLKNWLLEHPTFEMVSPGSAQAMAIKAKKQQLQQLSRSMAHEAQKQQVAAAQQPKPIQTTLKMGPSKNILIINPQTQSTVQSATYHTASPKQGARIQKTVQPLSTPTLSAGGVPKAVQSPTAIKVNPLAKASPAVMRKPDVKPNPSPAAATPSKIVPVKQEPIRVSVQRTLREQLKLRMAEQTDAAFPVLSDDDIDAFARNTEREMYALFGKDTGAKYRAKYRSLMFNIKDRKNTSLFLKICDRSIAAPQLVRMSADEMASQELAQWRENENKHQLEMIKKSELDLLSCAKSYVLKTHKGEEVIEGSIADRVSLDPSVSVEDVVSILNNSTVSSTSENLLDVLQSPVKDTRIDSRFERYHSGDLATVAGSSKTLNPTTVPRDPSGSKESTRNHSESKKSGSSSAKHSKRSRDRSKDRSRSGHHGDRRDDRNKSQKSSGRHSSSDKDKKRDDSKKSSTDAKPDKEHSSTPKTIVENFSMIDKILEAQSTIDRILHPEEFAKKETGVTPSNDPVVADDPKPVPTDLDLEPSSTVTIPTPPSSLSQQNDSPPMDVVDDTTSHLSAAIWTGSIFMVDVATFQISISPVVGDCSCVSTEMPDELDIVGRISPDTVWEYIGKIKKSINKEILVIRFDSATPDDKDAYFTLYKYLASRKRFGVIKTKSSLIKDFYIFPLAAHKSMPSIVSNVGKEFDLNRTDLLLGIIVLNVVVATLPLAKKRSSVAPPEGAPAKIPRIRDSLKTIVSSVPTDDTRYTPPCSPKVAAASALRSNPTPFSKLSTVMDDGDEPYSPGGSDDDDDDGSVVPYASLMTQMPGTAVSAVNPHLMALVSSSASNSRDQPSPTTSLDQADLQRKMEELVRQIEVQKQEIAMLGGDEPANVAAASGLSGIAIPSNLKEILNSIRGAPPPSTASAAINYGVEEYDPTAVVPSASGAIAYQPLAVGYVPAAVDNAPSKLAQLTDEELLNMVPDDIRNEILPPKRAKFDQSANMSRYTVVSQEPPPPGMGDEYVP